MQLRHHPYGWSNSFAALTAAAVALPAGYVVFALILLAVIMQFSLTGVTARTCWVSPQPSFGG